MSAQQILSPIDGAVYASFETLSDASADAALAKCRKAQSDWAAVPLDERLRYCHLFVAEMLARRDEIGQELTWQMGRPIAYTPREVDTLADGNPPIFNGVCS